MDKNTIIKWALIGVGVYLVYRYAVANGWLGTPAAATQLPAGSQPATGAQAQTQTQTQTQTQPATTPPPTAAAISQSLTAAVTANNLDPTAEYGGYEWAWFWQRASLYNGKNIGPTELGITDVAKAPMSLAVSAIQATYGVAGLQGLMRLLPPAPAFAAAWRM